MQNNISLDMLISKEDKEAIENKYHYQNKAFNPKQRMKYHGYDYDESTGLSDAEIMLGLDELAKKLENEHHYTIKSELFSYILDNTRIDINEHDYFIGIYTWDRVIDKHTIDPWQKEAYAKATLAVGNSKRNDFSKSGTAWALLDFDHTVPDWESLSTLGFVGILERLENSYTAIKSSGAITEKQELFYKCAKREYEALIKFTKRLYAYSLTKSHAKAAIVSESLKHLCEGAPQTTYDMLQLIYIYFMVSESVEHYQVRSLGYGLDGTLYPFYKSDIENRRFSKEEISRFIAYFMMQFSAMGNYWGQPFYLGGTNPDGSTAVNELSYLILDIYDKLGIYNPKIQIKVCKSTPKDFVFKALKMIIGGSTSIVFCNEDIIVKALMRNGATYDDATLAVVKGCYEYALRAKSIGISFNTFNALKPLCFVFSDGYDNVTGKLLGIHTGDVSEFDNFEKFYHAYLAQFDYVINENMKWIYEAEKYINDVNPSLLYAATIPACTEQLRDANDGGIINVSDMLLNGLGTAVDALMAVYELVFEKGVTTLQELKNALDNNWEGFEKLRLSALGCKHKYGRGDKLSDYYACAIHNFFASHFIGKKNSHGDNIEYELHSALAFLKQGKNTPATPDGRYNGDEVSKNASPTIGMDTNGLTALIRSVTSMDLSVSDSGACLDCMIHPSTVQGEEGADILYGVLNTYLSLGGASIHFNVFNSEMLKDAQANPDRYKNLQVRVCGWNVLWNNLSKQEQDAYILRAEKIIE